MAKNIKQESFIANKSQRFFGRRISRKLSKQKKNLLNNSLPDYEITIKNLKIFLSEKRRRYDNKFWLEVGFGSGEHLVKQAMKHPDIFFIGCDPYINGIVSLLDKIIEKKLHNIGIFAEDARELIRKSPNSLFSKVFILFPDPWPKKRHFKRRLINQDFLDSLFKAMENDGTLHICSDVLNYIRWTLYQVSKNSNFTWIINKSEDWKESADNRFFTKYAKKADLKKRTVFHIKLQPLK